MKQTIIELLLAVLGIGLLVTGFTGMDRVVREMQAEREERHERVMKTLRWGYGE